LLNVVSWALFDKEKIMIVKNGQKHTLEKIKWTIFF
jgi:hypothetical protein